MYHDSRANSTRQKIIPNNASPIHLSRVKARRDGRSQGAIGIQERSWVQQAVEGLGVTMAIS